MNTERLVGMNLTCFHRQSKGFLGVVRAVIPSGKLIKFAFMVK